jgi:DHA1 family tetracycline resistance protein-like MFS transporter
LTLALVGIASMIVQVGLVGPVVKRIGERRALLVGLLCGATGMTIFGLATGGVAFCLGIPVMALWGFAGPSAQGLMTRRVQPSEQGQLQGANSSIMGIANFVGPAIFSSTFAYGVQAGRGFDLPGAPFLVAALLLVLSALIARRATRLG